MDPDLYLRGAEGFTRALNTEYYVFRAGLKTALELSPIYGEYSHLFEGERFAEAKTWDLDPREVRYLLDFIAHGYVSRESRASAERTAAIEVASTVQWDEASIPYRQVPPLIAREADPVRRHDLEARYLAVMARLNPTLEEGEKNRQRAARQFGHPDYVAMYDELRGFKLQTLAETMQRFIAETDELYFSALDTYLHELRILRDDARRCDLARIFRGPQYDLMFPQDSMIAKLHSTLRGMGILLEDQINIRLDAEVRPLKSPRAFCATIQVPNDVRLVVKPSGGEQDYETLFHEAGHAEHYGNVDGTQPFAYRYLGDASVTEGYAFLLEYLIHDPSWLSRYATGADALGFFQLAGFHRLYMLRRYGSKLIYEQLLHQVDEPADAAEWYDNLLSRNLGCGHGPESYLTDVDDGFYCAAYLRAWMFEAQHRRFLRNQFDQEWFRNPKAGKFLIELWQEGQKYNVEEIARFMGYGGLDIAHVAEDIRSLMGAT
ncbi:MAG: hypothetical protein HY534_02680 [Chloroflexi bacterium]|nr:hypothetical protein [Chloroflexota bacterium]